MLRYRYISFYIFSILTLSSLFVFPHSAFAALSLDGNANGLDVTTPNAGVTLTTTHSNDIVVLEVFNESSSPFEGDPTGNPPVPVTSVTDTAGLTWHLRAATSSQIVQGWPAQAVGSDMELWWALAPSLLSSDKIVPALSGSTDCISYTAFGVNGANTASPWDTDGALPAQGYNISGTVTPQVSGISTNAANTMLIGVLGTGQDGSDNNGAGYTAGSGYTLIDQNVNGGCNLASGAAAEYKIVSSAQSNTTGAFASQFGGWFMTGDAIVDANQPVVNLGRIIRLRGGVRLIGGVRLK
jgi:hypothetical protein